MIAWLAEHQDVVVAVLVAVLVHLRAAMPAAKVGTIYSLVLQIWDIAAGNYGAAANKTPEAKQ